MREVIFSGALAAALIVATATPAWAADPDREARERYDNAVKLYEEGAYDAALVELNRAAELRPSYKLYYNIAQVRFAMHDYAAAMDAYRQYLDKGGDKVSAQRREQVQKELATLVQRVAKLSVEVDVAGAEIYVDDVLVGTSPLTTPIIVNSGIRRVTARHPEYVPQTKRLTLAGNVQDKVAFSLARGAAGENPGASATAPASGAAPPTGATTPSTQPAPGAESTPPAAPAPHKAADRRPNSVWIGWVATGALAAGATVTGVIALSKNSSLDSARKHLDVSDAEIDSRASKVRTFAIVTDTLGAAALIAGGVSLWLTLREGSQETTAAARAPRRQWQLGIAPRGVEFKTTF